MKAAFSVSVSMDKKVFTRFAFFDVFRLTERSLKLLGFVLLLVVLAVFNLMTGAALLSTVILAVGLLIPLSFLIRYRASTMAQVQRFHLEEPKPVYRIDFPQEGDRFVLTITDQPEQQIAFASLYGVYRTKHDFYLYVQKTQAYIVPIAQLGEGKADELWAYLQKHVSAAQDRRGLFKR